MLWLNGEKIIPPLGQKVVTIIQLAKVLYASQRCAASGAPYLRKFSNPSSYKLGALSLIASLLTGNKNCETTRRTIKCSLVIFSRVSDPKKKSSFSFMELNVLQSRAFFRLGSIYILCNLAAKELFMSRSSSHCQWNHLWLRTFQTWLK